MPSLSTIEGKLRAYTAVLLALPLLASCIAFYAIIRQANINAAYHDIHTATSYTKDSINVWLGHRAGDIEHVASIPSALLKDPKFTSDFFESFLKSHADFKSLLLFDTAGNVNTSAREHARGNVADREYFARARNGLATITSPLKSRFSGEYIIIVAHPVRNEAGDFSGVLAGAISINTILQTFSLSYSSNSWRPFLLDSRTRLPLADMEAGTAKIIPPADGETDTPQIYKNTDNARVIGACMPVKDGEWLVVMERPVAEILGGMERMLLVLAVASLGTMVALLPYIRRFSSGVLGPVKTISALSTRMLEGQYDAECILIDTNKTPVEIATLYDNFCKMSERLIRYVEELEIYTSTDPLTGLGNRRSLQKEGARIIEMCRRSGAECSCLVLDLDHFKRVNDTYGHPTGDVALQTASAIIMRNIRKADFAARLGGEEFTVIASHTPTGQAMVLAERIRADVERTPITHDGHTFTMTISIGVAPVSASCDSSTTPLDDVISKADCALYKAKNNGRNRVEQWRAEDATMSCKHHL
ncbi:diguanylate cyclase [Nitratidesulfovibrio sp. HK-II]|uniref:sensor domain-containing diguanylate cyclase n=1 Tax=Nitratidesulfovibrio sp. HK-II TaxID=2009266 RepID=UPI000E2ECA6E|nr:diguanylate cyclase [Nitratidesulfovibrio sp. HK-II]GBO96155.1 diguanylate cyclase DosC [Nitratidesulfovibrio sp. HK-II]